MVDDQVPADVLVDVALLGRALDEKVAEELRSASRSSEGFERLEELDRKLQEGFAKLAGQVDLEKVGLSVEQVADLGKVMQNLRGLHLPVDDLDIPDMAAAEVGSLEDSFAYQELEAGIGREEYDLDVDSSFHVLVEAGVIVQCDGCGRQVLAENSHRFSVLDGEVLCGPCRNVDRDKQ